MFVKNNGKLIYLVIFFSFILFGRGRSRNGRRESRRSARRVSSFDFGIGDNSEWGEERKNETYSLDKSNTKGKR
jgi:hypothetical protein